MVLPMNAGHGPLLPNNPGPIQRLALRPTRTGDPSTVRVHLRSKAWDHPPIVDPASDAGGKGFALGPH